MAPLATPKVVNVRASIDVPGIDGVMYEIEMSNHITKRLIIGRAKFMEKNIDPGTIYLWLRKKLLDDELSVDEVFGLVNLFLDSAESQVDTIFNKLKAEVEAESEV